jgi:hypothetical protein
MNLVIDTQGRVHGIYSEVIDLRTLGTLVIRRASQVEPDGEGRWWADLAPVGGPRLGPFEKRSQALTEEVVWLEKHWRLAQNRCLHAPAEGKFRETFITPFEQDSHRIGHNFTVVRELTDDERNPDVGTMYRIRFEDGGEIDAWPEETCHEGQQ